MLYSKTSSELTKFKALNTSTGLENRYTKREEQIREETEIKDDVLTLRSE